MLRVVAERLVIVLFVLHMLLVFFCYSPGLQAEALFLHRASWVWPPCSLDHPERGAAISWLPRTSELLQLAEDQPRTEAHRLQGEAGGLGLWLTRPDPACSTGGAWVLHLHGNGESRCWAKTARKAALLAAPPFCAHVATPDYRGFGDSDGSPYNHSDDQPAQPASAADLVADARIALRWLRQRRQADSGGEGPLVLYGHSLGSHVALALAAEETCPRCRSRCASRRAEGC